MLGDRKLHYTVLIYDSIWRQVNPKKKKNTSWGYRMSYLVLLMRNTNTHTNTGKLLDCVQDHSDFK